MLGITFDTRQPDGEPDVILRDRWRFAREESGRVVPDGTHVWLDGGFEKGRLYQVVYTAVGAPVLATHPDDVVELFLGFLTHPRGLAPDELHDEIRKPLGCDAAVVETSDMRMLKPRQRLAFAREAIDVMTTLLERHGQAGDCYEDGGAYHSSFLVADPTEAWILETAGSTWAAKRTTQDAAISNRLSLAADWDDASGDIDPGANFQQFRDSRVDTGFADVRLKASLACVARGAAELTPADLAAHLRDHGEGPWGAPGTDASNVSPVPEPSEFTVCMHVQGISVTTAAMVCELPEDPAEPARAWVALGAPCASVFVPASVPEGVPAELGETSLWSRFATLRERAESDADGLSEIRNVLGPLEAEMWASGTASSSGIEEALDGLKVDQQGNLYVSGPGGLWVISVSGKHLGTIIAPKHVHNMAWGDDDGKTLYLCAKTGLYRMRLNIAGVRP